MPNVGTVLAGIVAIGVLYVLLPVVTDVFLRFRAARRLRCPEAGAGAEVRVDATRTAMGAAFHDPTPRVADCSLWPERAGCEEGCLPAFEAAAPVTQGTKKETISARA